MARTYDVQLVEPALRHMGLTADFVDWLANPANIALVNDQGDIALFEYGLPNHKVYSGHYYFKSRGRLAIQAAKSFIDELFNSCYNIDVVLGLAPIHHKAARWLSRQVGFKSYGFDELNGKEYEIFILTKRDFRNG